MGLAAYVPLSAALLNAFLAVFVLRTGVQSSTRFAYLIWGMSIAIWNFGTFQMFRVESREAALEWARFLQIGVIFLPISLLQLCLHVCNLERRKLVLCAYGAGLCLAGTVFTPLFVSDVRDAGFAWYSVGGPAFWVFTILYAILTGSTLFFLWRAQASAARFRRSQIRSLLWATGILIAGGNNDILPILGIYSYPFLNVPIFPIGSLCAIFYGILVGYSVLQHQLLDIQIGLSRVAAHLMRMAFLFLIGFVLMLVVSLLAPANAISAFAFWAALAVLLVSGFTASHFMPKLLGAGQDSLERRLLGDHFEYQDKVRAFMEDCRWHTELDALLNELRSLLVHVMKVRTFWFVLLDESNRAFTLVRAMPESPQHQIPGLRVDSAVFEFLRSGNPRYIALRPDRSLRASKLQTEAREDLKDFPGNLAFPLFVDHQPLGLLIVGDKNSGDTFTRTDAQLLSELTVNVALVIKQISIKTELLQAKELDLLGRMSQGMAHDLNNLITPVWTLLQLLTEGVPAETLRIDIAPVAVRNLQTMRDYIKEALFFSQNLRPDFQVARLDTLVKEVVELAKQNKRKGRDIRYTFRSCGDVPMEMDQVLIRRLLTNILANAVDASKEGDSLDVEVIRLVKTDAERDWFRVRITDHGTGIPQENLDRIFQPYYSTKKTGDEDRGFGLGLAICRKIAALHGGNLVVSSEVGRGTIVNLDLPDHQKAAKTPTTPTLVAAST